MEKIKEQKNAQQQADLAFVVAEINKWDPFLHAEMNEKTIQILVNGSAVGEPSVTIKYHCGAPLLMPRIIGLLIEKKAKEYDHLKDILGQIQRDLDNHCNGHLARFTLTLG